MQRQNPLRFHHRSRKKRASRNQSRRKRKRPRRNLPPKSLTTRPHVSDEIPPLLPSTRRRPFQRWPVCSHPLRPATADEASPSRPVRCGTQPWRVGGILGIRKEGSRGGAWHRRKRPCELGERSSFGQARKRTSTKSSNPIRSPKAKVTNFYHNRYPRFVNPSTKGERSF